MKPSAKKQGRPGFFRFGSGIAGAIVTDNGELTVFRAFVRVGCVGKGSVPV
ncbi:MULTISPECIES: hypothetical protein [unclassified Haematospirillum]|uniref:hypothetical protein n=1 Tax=unclassified Haematospirillum TaxID=2622088 RepID=UPI00143B6992|nr:MULTISPECIES: hypothetical protein [unclassified Haematospirillum]NKD55535.1 hypothetical protein [Haematospirillum sp. H4890]NKD75675.1 hypothetical protein [Haematospirillum sp. H4485]NKD86785.1 hypothetical protein [Haematospirillum sp. 15-248]